MFFLPHFASKAANLAKRLSKDPKTQLPQPSDVQLGNIKPSVRKDRTGGIASTSRDITAMSSKLNTKQLEVWTRRIFSRTEQVQRRKWTRTNTTTNFRARWTRNRKDFPNQRDHCKLRASRVHAVVVRLNGCRFWQSARQANDAQNIWI